MPTKKSNPAKRSPNKRKANARSRAATKVSRRRGAGDVRVRGSIKEISQGRFPGETALTGEDRPSTRAGGKRRDQREGRANARGERTSFRGRT
jgi:hypothetical protein